MNERTDTGDVNVHRADHVEGRRREPYSDEASSMSSPFAADRTVHPSIPATNYDRSMLSVSGLALLTATKFTDALTTGIGLLYVPGIYEANPAVDFVLYEAGIVHGLLVSSFVIIVAITLITELAAIGVASRWSDGHLAPMVRVVGYGIPAAVFAVVSVYNVTVILAAIEIAGPI